MKSPSATLGFSCSPNKYTCDILSEDLVSHRLKVYSSKNEVGVLRYINKVKSIHGIGLSTTCGYQSYGKKQVLMLELCFLNLILH